jgi:drug/metabolite transporter (DMT)-like permease
MTSAQLGFVRCGIAAVLFGLSAPAASRLTDDMGGFTLAGLLYLGAALAVAPFVGRATPSVAALRSSLPRLSIAVILGGAVGPVLLAFGLGLVPAATASLLLNLELVLTIVVAGLVFHEHIGRHVAIGTALVVVGTVLLASPSNPDLRWGALLIAGACLCWAVDNSVTAVIDQISPSTITLAKGLIAGSTNLAIGLAATSIPSAAPVLWALLIGAFGYGASITLWVSGARDLGAARGQLVFATAPFVGAIFAWTAFAEPWSAREIASFIVASAGVGFVLFSRHEHEHTHEPLSHSHDHEHDDHHAHRHDPPVTGRHTHHHEHGPVVHRHPHVPDLHHRHEH